MVRRGKYSALAGVQGRGEKASDDAAAGGMSRRRQSPPGHTHRELRQDYQRECTMGAAGTTVALVAPIHAMNAS